jgi:hypothetical protein
MMENHGPGLTSCPRLLTLPSTTSLSLLFFVLSSFILATSSRLLCNTYILTLSSIHYSIDSHSLRYPGGTIIESIVFTLSFDQFAF